MQTSVEFQRLSRDQRALWQRWGSYVSGRSWGTVRESDPQLHEKAWEAFPFEQARSRAYRWAEDGIAGFSDEQQRLCMALALWNEQDPILKERYFGLSNEQGNHGEDVKDYFFYLDGVPSYSYLKMLYRYPQVEFPYGRLVRENSVRGQDERDVDLIDVLNSAFRDNRYFDIFVEYAKADPDDVLCRITVVNRADQPAPLHLLPQIWFRNTWQEGGARPALRADGDNIVIVDHAEFTAWWHVEAADALLFTENETNNPLVFDTPAVTPYAKDAIDYAVVRGQQERVNSAGHGTKCAAHFKSVVEAGASWVIRTRLTTNRLAEPFNDFDAVLEQRQREADEFYERLQRPELTPEEKFIQRTAFAGITWNKNFYHFNVRRWLENAETQVEHENEEWRHFDAHDVLSIADTWEYPWIAGWDLSFQITTLAIVDPEFAKAQTLLLLSDRYMRADGALPAFEGDLATPHPPVHAWATWHVYHMTGFDRSFLSEAYGKLKQHFEWWLNTQMHADHLFGGGFLGADNVSVFDRNKDVPDGAWLAQADGTSWMALFALNMLGMAVELGRDDEAVTYLDHFLRIRSALFGLWDEETHFLYDVLHMPDGESIQLKVRSVVGLIALSAVLPLNLDAFKPLKQIHRRLLALGESTPDFRSGADGHVLLAALSQDKLEHVINTVFDPSEFHSPYGVRSLSCYHEDHPVIYEIDGKEYTLRYEPGDSSDKMFGGNSNWRGPVWAPINQLIAEALHAYHDHYGERLSIQSGEAMTLEQGALDLVKRLVNLFKRDAEGRRPFFGTNEYLQNDPHWRDYLLFYEHFHGSTGAGLGASHQNGWTALIAKLIQNEGRSLITPVPHREIGDR